MYSRTRRVLSDIGMLSTSDLYLRLRDQVSAIHGHSIVVGEVFLGIAPRIALFFPNMVFDQLFEPETGARLIGFADRQQNALTLPEVIDACAKKVFGAPAPPGMLRSLQRQTQRVFVDAVMTLGASPTSTPDVKATVMASLAAVRTQVAGLKDPDPVNEASLRQIERDLTRYAQNPTMPKKSSATPPIMAPI